MAKFLEDIYGKRFWTETPEDWDAVFLAAKEAGVPMEELRNRLLDNCLSSRKLSRGYVASLVIKAWNAERTGRSIKRLRGWTGDSNEAFPVAV